MHAHVCDVEQQADDRHSLSLFLGTDYELATAGSLLLLDSMAFAVCSHAAGVYNTL